MSKVLFNEFMVGRGQFRSYENNVQVLVLLGFSPDRRLMERSAYSLSLEEKKTSSNSLVIVGWSWGERERERETNRKETEIKPDRLGQDYTTDYLVPEYSVVILLPPPKQWKALPRPILIINWRALYIVFGTSGLPTLVLSGTNNFMILLY